MNAVNVRRIIFRSNHGDIWRAYSMSSCFRCSGESFPACPRFSTCYSPVRPEGHMNRSIYSSLVRRSAS